ncbi:MAG: lysophospholipase L1-like esterase [Oceanicoccus sp.]|jgi:lysophospholipase L1-like esterase
MPNPDIDYARNIQKFEKLVVRNRFRVKHFAKWPGVKRKPIIISEGDSWFDFPVKSLTDVIGVVLRYSIGLKNFGMDSKTNVIDFLSRDQKLNGIFLRLERSGDHASELAAKEADKRCGVWEEKFPSHTLFSALQNTAIQKHLDAIVLSAGGNDMVDAVRHGVIQTYTGDWQTSYDKDLLAMAAQEVAQYYLQAILYRDEFAPQAQIVTHSYAYAVHLHSGTTTEFDFSEAGKLIKELLSLLKLEMILAPLKTIGVNLTDMGDYKLVSKARLHETFDKCGWPKNEVDEDDPKSGKGVNPERAHFIKAMLDALFDEMQNLPTLYQAQTGQPLVGFTCLDVRNDVQDAKYWADFIHLNGDGYKVIAKTFSKKLQEHV